MGSIRSPVCWGVSIIGPESSAKLFDIRQSPLNSLNPRARARSIQLCGCCNAIAKLSTVSKCPTLKQQTSSRLYLLSGQRLVDEHAVELTDEGAKAHLEHTVVLGIFLRIGWIKRPILAPGIINSDLPC